MNPSSLKFADGVSQNAQSILVKLYDDAATKISESVIRPFGKTADARKFTRARAATLIQQIERLRANVAEQTSVWLGGNVPTAYEKGLRTAEQQLKALGLKSKNIPVQGGFSRIDERTVAVIAADMAASLDAALGDQAKAAARFLRAAQQAITPDAEISRVIGQAAITGDMKQAVRDMRGLLNAAKIEDYRKAGQQIITVGAANMTVKAYSEMLVRTRLREATVHARHERLIANGNDLVTVIGRISENFCTEYVGRVFSITGESSEYPALAELPGGGPPFHPNCSKSTTAYIERFATPMQRRYSRGVPKALLTADAGKAQVAYDTKTGPDRARTRLEAIAA